MIENELLFEANGHLSPTLNGRISHNAYKEHPFEVPAGVSKITVILQFHSTMRPRICLVLYDSEGFRGYRMRPRAQGDVRLELWVAPDDASVGGLPGPLPADIWNARLEIRHIREEIDYKILVFIERGSIANPLIIDYPDAHVVNIAAGWYRGELHCHSTESDGDYPVSKVVETAVELGLDFLSLTDHSTITQWRKLADVIDQPIALIRSCESSPELGHANLHGMRAWIDPFIDRPDGSYNAVADEIHAQGGLFCVNHAYSSNAGWKDFHFDWSRADLFEVWNVHEACNNDYMMALWDHVLNLGHRVIGVPGIDSHHPEGGIGKLGQAVTYVYADQLSETGIINGLRRGRVYGTRGPLMNFRALCEDGRVLEMGDTVTDCTAPISLEVEYISEEPLRLFVIKNGIVLHHLEIEESPKDWRIVRFNVESIPPTFYRIELHRLHRDEQLPHIAWRDHTTIQAFSNPIWVKSKPV